MTTKRRGSGEGSIDPRGDDAWRLRYRVNGERFAVTLHGTLADAKRELRRRLREGDQGQHVAPTKLTVEAWSKDWLGLLAARGVTTRTREGYHDALRLYILPTLGARVLQAVTVTDIDKLYAALAKHISAATVQHAHVAVMSMLGTAVRKGLLQTNPAAVATVPRAAAQKVGQALDVDELPPPGFARRFSRLHAVRAGRHSGIHWR